MNQGGSMVEEGTFNPQGAGQGAEQNTENAVMSPTESQKPLDFEHLAEQAGEQVGKQFGEQINRLAEEKYFRRYGLPPAEPRRMEPSSAGFSPLIGKQDKYYGSENEGRQRLQEALAGLIETTVTRIQVPVELKGGPQDVSLQVLTNLRKVMGFVSIAREGANHQGIAPQLVEATLAQLLERGSITQEQAERTRTILIPQEPKTEA